MGEERSLGGEEQEEMPLLPWELHAESWEQSSTCSPVGHSSRPRPLTGFSPGSQASFPTWSLSPRALSCASCSFCP